MTLFDRVFRRQRRSLWTDRGRLSTAQLRSTAKIKQYAFPDTAYSLPCYYAVTGTKVTNLGELKAALGVVKTLMTREKRLNDAFMSGVATALCAEFIEVLKYIERRYSRTRSPATDIWQMLVIRELGVPLVTGDIPGVAVILGSAPCHRRSS